MNFLERETNNKKGALVEDSNKEEKELLNRWANFTIQIGPRRPQLHRLCYCSLSSLNILPVSFLSLDTFVSIPLSINPPFLI